MKKIIFFYFLMVFSFPLFSQDVNKPVIVFDTVVYDFGTIYKGDNAECVFNFQNNGKLPLIITEVKASCGCTVPTWTKEPVKPGARGSVKVKYNTNTVGVFSKTITVNSNDNAHRTVTLTIKGDVKKKT
ncbi:MAG TPA: DUF1573 domain-containing protein [Bacteroidales bacterium]|nr:DUF1573 domain-containing protein [Bacteroidales bacterium]HOV11614.1 DUF1573 domain-containing protein [Bacteroidales bacterium]HPS26755.1 DUF1573 domain-containing protein [Bacteroidales bacterium]HQI69334.1 DUF1573 domain-containing protein [Bacteroidales bacterium]